MNQSSQQFTEGEILLSGEQPRSERNSTVYFYQSKSSIVESDRENKYLSCGDFLELPCADKSLQSLTLRSGLEKIDRKYLYMILSEARRVLVMGGILDISAFEYRRLFQWASIPANALFSLNPLNLNHFISPEDWEILEQEERRSLIFIHRRLVLKRIDGILPEIGDSALLTDDLPES